MDASLSPAQIRAARVEHSQMRERDLAAHLGISEAALVASEIGLGVTRVDAGPAKLLAHVKSLGEVMVLTRNESAVHEKIGLFEDLHPGKQVSMTLGENIDLRIFGAHWVHGFAVEREVKGDVRRSLQYFDAAGQAVFKLHLRSASDVAAFGQAVSALRLDEQSQEFIAAKPVEPPSAAVPEQEVDRSVLRGHWQAMTDPHQFFGMLKTLNIARRTAVRQVGEDFAWALETASLGALLDRAAADAVEIMCFVANNGCVQIHTGTVQNIQRMGPWINVMDPTFHLHLRQDHVAEVWAVRKPADRGHVTSIEAYDADGNMIIQFFGKRKEGLEELTSWRSLAESLPRADAIAA